MSGAHRGEGRATRPPPDKPPDRFIAPIAVAAVLLTAASLIAIYATGIAPDATANTCTHSTQGDIPCLPPAAVDASGLDSVRPIARRVTATSALSPTSTATVPAPVAARTPRPSRSATGTWSSSLPSTASGRPGSGLGSTSVLETTLTRESPSLPEPTPDSPHATETPDTTPTSPAETAATSEEPASSDPTQEPTVTAEPTADPTPTDIEDVIDEVLGTETP